MNSIFKYCFFTIYFSIISYNGLSQNFISEDKLWRNGSKIYSEPCCGYINYAYKFKGDSIIHDTIYSKLLYTHDGNIEQWELAGLWRETTDQKIFVRDLYFQTEKLLYDFSLVKNDTFRVFDICLRVDSVLTINWGGKLRKHWYLNPVSGNEFHRTLWIEGLGQFNVLTSSLNGSIGATPILMCFTDNWQIVYQNPDYNTCIYTLVENIPKQSKDYKVYPNPVSENLIIESNLNKMENIIGLYSMKGDLIMTECMDNGGSRYSMDVRSLKSGSYVLRIQSSNGKYAEEVIIKN